MKTLFASGLLAAVSLTAAGRDEPKPAAGPLAGEWKFVSYTHTGADLPLDKDKSRVTFADGKMTIRFVSGSDEQEQVSTFTADEKADPKALDVSPPDRKFVAKAIWKVEKERLTISFAVGGDERPKDFAPTKTTSVLVLEKAKK